MEYLAPTTEEVTQMEKDHADIVRKAAGECVVLLKNDHVLPLAGKGKLALFGSGARLTVKGGTGSGDVYSRTVVNFEQGFEAAGFEITSKDWMDRYDAKHKKAIDDYHTWIAEESKKTGSPEFLLGFNNPFEEAAPELITVEDIAASETDTAVYVISRNSGEGADRYNKPGDYKLFEEEKKNLELLGKSYKNVTLALNIGGVMDMTEIDSIEGIGAVVLISQLGNIGGHILPEVLLGQVNPSGKLVDTWAKQYQDYPSSETFSHNNGDVHDDAYSEGIYVGYRYFDSFNVNPQYAFGFGLSYTDFEMHVNSAEINGSLVTVEVDVKNIGDKFSGKEVVQVYLSKPAGTLDKPYQDLVGFAKTAELAPGASETVSVSFDMKKNASYSEAKEAYVLEAGSYVVRVGNSSKNNTAVAAVNIASEIVTLQCKNVFAAEEGITKLLAPAQTLDTAGLIQLQLESTAICTENVELQIKRTEYKTDKSDILTIADVKAGKCAVEELVSQLTVEELATMCVGTLRQGEGSIVGNASQTVPGAAGDSSSILCESRGVKNIIQADGPAGLRLQTHFKTTKDGEVLPGGEMFAEFVTPFDESKIPADAIDRYQYCTAIPIGWALAHSWNEQMVSELGDMVGEEMEIFKIDLWLAPALNIHRNPLCGRNFEYYSEDPLIAGKIAAAMTKGVQKHAGKGTTIKHFAVNNQEDNRYFTNAHVSERALREIYLKGFEIAVRESKPLSLMTSYNLINGIHAANHKALLQFVLRDEWGFDGFVMTDWFTSQDMPMLTGGAEAKYPISASTGCVFAGNDLQMPGCSKNVNDLVESVNLGKELDGYQITLADLQYCAANIIRVAAKM